MMRDAKDLAKAWHYVEMEALTKLMDDAKCGLPPGDDRPAAALVSASYRIPRHDEFVPHDKCCARLMGLDCDVFGHSSGEAK